LLVRQSSQEVRTLAYLLHPPLLDEMGLLSAIRWYVEGFEKRTGISVSVNLDEIARLSRSAETALFRVVQESLTNVSRHASSAVASIHLAKVPAGVTLEISDRGHGFRSELIPDERGSPKTIGVGIHGMRERIRHLGGAFDVAFSRSGTTVRATVPLGAT